MAKESIRVEGVRELTRALAKVDADLPKQIAKANQKIGQRIIDRVFPTPRAVGSGKGAEPRAVASRNYVAIQAGRSERKLHVQQWGARFVKRTEPRPFILGTALHDEPDIEKEYLDNIDEAIRQASAE